MLRLLKVFVVVLIALGLDFSSAFAAVTPLNEYSGVSLMSTRSAAADGGTRAEQTPCSTDDWPHSVDATSLESTASDTSYLTQETYCNGEYEFQFSACAGNSVLPYTTAYTDDRSDWDNNNIGWCCGYRHDHSIVAEGGDNTPERGTPTAYCYLASDPENVPLYCETNDWPYSSSPTELGSSVAQNSRYSVTKTYCYNNEQTPFVECASEDILPYTTDSFDGMYNLTSNSYCEGYRDGDSTRRYYIPNSPDWCTYKGVTNTDYIAKIANDEVACIPTVTSQQTCTNNDDVSLTYCKVGSESSFTQCPDEYTVTSQSDCGAGGDQPRTECYVDCGEVYCLGYACTEAYQACQDLFDEKVAEGYKLTAISSTSSDDYTACNDGGTLKYLKFGCKDFVATNLSEGETCATLGAENASSCTYYEELTSATTTTQYQCKCNDNYKTEAECAAELANGDTEKIVIGGSECTLPLTDSPTRAADDPEEPQVQQAPTEYQYCRLKSEMCSNGDTPGVHYKDDLSYKYYPSSQSDNVYPAVEWANCYLTADDENKTAVALYCRGFEDIENIQKELCQRVNGKNDLTSTKCKYPIDNLGNEGELDYYYCACEGKTKEEYCENDTDCIENAVLENPCYTHPLSDATADNPTYYSGPRSKVLGSGLTCSPEYKTKEEWCSANSSSIPAGYNCERDYIGMGDSCTFDDEEKYTRFALSCQTNTNATVKDSADECLLGGEERAYYNECQYYDSNTSSYKTKYVCKCPQTYGTECQSAYMSRGGTQCNFDLSASGDIIIKYSTCSLTCNTNYAAAISEDLYSCPNVGDFVSNVRTSIDNNNNVQYEKCVLTTNASRPQYYICACPTNFQTIDVWCEHNYAEEGATSVDDCVRNFIGVGDVCRLDIETDTNNNPIKALTKYTSYARYCPTDRPLYYSEEDCSFIGGEYEYSCLDSNHNERVVCQCPTSWYTTNDDELDARTCETAVVGENIYSAEASGEYCDFDGTENLKYEECVVKCTDLLNGVALEGAYTYLSTDNQTPTQTLCHNTLGNGAVLGVASQIYCSLNNTLMYPCYCPDDFEECPASENLMPASNALVCRINGKTYYSGCTEAACALPSSDTVILDPNTFPDTGTISAIFGPKVTIKKCTNDAGQPAWEVKCDSKVYTDPCDYPYEPDPSNSDYCLVGENGANLNASSRPHYKSGQCKVQKNFGVCGEEIVGSADGDYTIAAVTQTESECTSKFGPGAKSQLCEYGKEQGYKRAYNCYYNPKEFIYTTANCGVRHDLTGNYIILNGKKYWSECNCTSAYQHHKFNCGGMLSGNPCQQYITQDFINEFGLSEEGYSVGEQIPFYPYCECSADYTEICDEDGSGRYKGVGTACNGKYTACECVPDKLPDNWTDNYYGCPGGKKPTGVWKDNGCGQKYYQCEVVECTWEYTEMCEAPLIPVGQSCQDNEGNIGGYKSCTCPSDYKVCAAGQVGEGEPCNLKGVSYYKSCTSQDGCTSLASETCTGPLQIGVNPCTRDDITYFESCVCANGYDKVCGEGEVGVGNYCELDGVKYYKECVNPKDNECTDGHVTACDTNQESYSPCTAKDELTGKEIVKYMCRCPTNWKACDGGSGEQCTSKDASGKETTYYEECNSGAPTCSPYQELTYKVCTPAQTGDGGSCTSSTSSTDATGTEITVDVIKYAVCKDSGNCLTNGFRFSCTGYDQSALGESCVDDQGNKLYKECPCPKSYVECSNGNATKGKKCVPLLQSGSYGPTVYSSCECDRSKYKYTCEVNDKDDPYNKGIKAPSNSSNYCEIEEEVEVSVDEVVENDDGTTSTITRTETETKKVRYYSSCECRGEYAYTCTENGEIIPEDYTEDYCQINSTKFYKGCACQSEFNITASDCQDGSGGKTVDTSKGYCTPKGKIPSSEDGSIPTQSVGTKYYKGCTCKNGFDLECSDDGYNQEGLPYCELEAGSTKLYAQCKCNNDTSQTCFKSGRNQGIMPNEDDYCEEMVSNGGGSISINKKYKSCTCQEEYSIAAETCEDDFYNQSNETYCDLSVNEGITGVETGKFYKKCACNTLIYDDKINAGSTTPDAEAYCTSQGKEVRNGFDLEKAFCPEYSSSVDASGNAIGITTYRPNRSLCCSTSELEGYTPFDTQTYSSLADFYNTYGEESLKTTFKTKCGHANNAVIALDCSGKPYYKCSNPNVTNSSSWYTQEECAMLDRNEISTLKTSGTPESISESWLGIVDVYPSCSCPSNYNKSQSCRTISEGKLKDKLKSGMTPIVCFNMGHKYGEGGTRFISDSYDCSDMNTNSELCIDIDNSNKYDWSKCRCNRETYVHANSGNLQYCKNTNGSSRSCHHKFCVDYTGIYRDASGHKKDQGGATKTWGSTMSCNVSNKKLICTGAE